MLNKIIVKIVKFYQIIMSPFLGENCRFCPSCSEYLSQAIQKHGTAKGVFLGIKRVLRCNPWTAGGIDFP